MATHFSYRYITALAVAALLPASLAAAAPPTGTARIKIPARPKARPEHHVPWQREVEIRKKNAARLAAAKQYAGAAREILAAKKALQDGAREERRAARMPKHDPAYERELKSLQAWLAEQRELVRKKKAEMPKVVALFTEKKEAIGRKYGVKPDEELNRFHDMQRTQAKYVLMAADLDDLAAGYLERGGDRDGALQSREQAGLSRLRAYRVLEKAPEALAQAEKLLQLNSPNPVVYNAAAEYLQSRKLWEKAAASWRQVIDLVESGKARPRKIGMSPGRPDQTGRQVAVYYRQLAFCYQQLGKKAESQAAMEKARKLDVTVPPPGRRRP